MILWDYLLAFILFFLFVIEDIVSFKFGGICVGIRVGSVLFCLFLLYIFFIFIFACYRFSSVLVVLVCFSMLKTESCPYVPTYLHSEIL